VAEQAEPDGLFPTLRSPNPEEPDALERAERLARETGADLLLANDPDADRLAAAVPTPSGRWVRLTGNQIGLLLGEFVLRSAPKTPTPLVVSTVVSSPALSVVADAYGARFERTLTGFKWILKTALELERDAGVRFVFGFEEALGYSVGGVVRDKDGISAALLFAELCAECRARGQSIREHLTSLYERYGLWASAQVTAAFSGTAAMNELLAGVERVAAAPPATLDGLAVRGTTDLRRAADESVSLPPAALVRFDLGGGSEAWIRPSGTEPKLKIYVNLRGDPGEAFGDCDRELSQRAERVGRALLSAVGVAAAGRSQDSAS
jgi:phosphomannomutase